MTDFKALDESKKDENECECECEHENEQCDCVYDMNGGQIPPKELLMFASETRGAYRDRKRELKQKQADLRLNTDWSKAIPDKSRISEKDKEAWITLATIELQSEVDDLETEAAYLSELWKLEKIMLRQ